MWLNACSTVDPARRLGTPLVDLGLSVKWYSCNVGAAKPENVGTKLSWSELIDVVHNSEFSGGYSLIPPSYDQWMELKNKCKWEWVSNAKRTGYIITGPNGKSIFLPATDSSTGQYWTDTSYYSDKETLYFSSDGTQKKIARKSEKICARLVVLFK